jgi:hypothetical protein
MRARITRVDGTCVVFLTTMTFLCAPIYALDPGDENKAQHTGSFYAVVSRHWKGIVTSK